MDDKIYEILYAVCAILHAFISAVWFYRENIVLGIVYIICCVMFSLASYGCYRSRKDKEERK